MKVTVVTQAYNTRKYIEKCVESVLGQTHTDLEYILIDNGCFDGTENLIKEYAEKDKRIKTIRFEKNEVKTRWYKPFLELGTGEYFVSLDSDDWLEPDFLEKLLEIAVSTQSDIVATGSFMHVDGTSIVEKRQATSRLLIEGSGFAELYPYYHVFFRTMWGKLISSELMRSSPWKIDEGEKTGIRYGMDTIQSFAWLRNCKRVCVDNSILHHYRINQKSVSHHYNPSQIRSDVHLFSDAVDFLSAYGSISVQNVDFLYRVYANAIYDTAWNIRNSDLSPEDKMREYAKILTNKLTVSACAFNNEDVELCKRKMLMFVLHCAGLLSVENELLDAVMRAQLPECGSIVSVKDIKLFLLEERLMELLIKDDREQLVIELSQMIVQKKYTKQYDLPEMLRKLSQDRPMLCGITDIKFLRKYDDIYIMIWQEKYVEALDAASQALTGNRSSNETLIQIYLTLAAFLERADEFVFGKMKLAAFYAEEKRFDDCRTVLDELEEMKVEDSEELLAIKNAIRGMNND